MTKTSHCKNEFGSICTLSHQIWYINTHAHKLIVAEAIKSKILKRKKIQNGTKKKNLKIFIENNISVTLTRINENVIDGNGLIYFQKRLISVNIVLSIKLGL